MDRKLLLTLIEKFNGGPAGIETIAASLREDRETIEDVYEPYLLQEGLLERTPRGRLATRNAFVHLGKDHSERIVLRLVISLILSFRLVRNRLLRVLLMDKQYYVYIIANRRPTLRICMRNLNSRFRTSRNDRQTLKESIFFGLFTIHFSPFTFILS